MGTTPDDSRTTDALRKVLDRHGYGFHYALLKHIDALTRVAFAFLRGAMRSSSRMASFIISSAPPLASRMMSWPESSGGH